jgi:DNA processing protein
LQIIDKLTVDKPIGLDDLIDSLPDASSSEIIAALFELELAGLVRQLPGKQFARIWV